MKSGLVRRGAGYLMAWFVALVLPMGFLSCAGTHVNKAVGTLADATGPNSLNGDDDETALPAATGLVRRQLRQAQHGAAGLVGIYQQLNMSVTTQTYDNGFYIVALMSAGGAVLALLLRSGKAKSAGGPVHVEV